MSSASTSAKNLRETSPRSPQPEKSRISWSRLLIVLGVLGGLSGTLVLLRCPWGMCPTVITAKATVIPNPKTHQIIRMPISGIVTLKPELNSEPMANQLEVKSNQSLVDVKSLDLENEQNKLTLQTQQAELQSVDAQGQIAILEAKVLQIAQDITVARKRLTQQTSEIVQTPQSIQAYETQIRALETGREQMESRLERFSGKKLLVEQNFSNQDGTELGVNTKDMKLEVNIKGAIPEVLREEIRIRIAGMNAEINNVKAQMETAKRQLTEKQQVLDSDLIHLEALRQSAQEELAAAKSRAQDHVKIKDQLAQELTQKQANQPSIQPVLAKEEGTIITPNLKALNGKFLQVGEPILEIVNLADLQLEIEIPPTDTKPIREMLNKDLEIAIQPQEVSASECKQTVKLFGQPIYHPKDQTQQIIWKVLAQPTEPLNCFKDLRPGAKVEVQIKTADISLDQHFRRWIHGITVPK